MFNFITKMFAVQDTENEYISAKQIVQDKEAATLLEQRRHAAIEVLGDKWILKGKVQRKS